MTVSYFVVIFYFFRYIISESKWESPVRNILKTSSIKKTISKIPSTKFSHFLSIRDQDEPNFKFSKNNHPLHSKRHVHLVEEHLCHGISNFSTSVCNSHGKCISLDTCVCSAGYFGHQCNYTFNCFEIGPDDSLVCSGNGLCKDQDDCQCLGVWNDWFGNKKCEITQGQFILYVVLICAGVLVGIIICFIFFVTIIIVIVCRVRNSQPKRVVISSPKSGEDRASLLEFQPKNKFQKKVYDVFKSLDGEDDTIMQQMDQELLDLHGDGENSDDQGDLSAPRRLVPSSKIAPQAPSSIQQQDLDDKEYDGEDDHLERKSEIENGELEENDKKSERTGPPTSKQENDDQTNNNESTQPGASENQKEIIFAKKISTPEVNTQQIQVSIPPKQVQLENKVISSNDNDSENSTNSSDVSDEEQPEKKGKEVIFVRRK